MPSVEQHCSGATGNRKLSGGEFRTVLNLWIGRRIRVRMECQAVLVFVRTLRSSPLSVLGVGGSELTMSEVSRLPAPVFSSYEWQNHGACVGEDSYLFFHPEGERGAAGRARDRAALALCATCSVIAACRQHGLSAQEAYGVWGGLTEGQREALIVADRHAVARPRSSERRSPERRPHRRVGELHPVRRPDLPRPREIPAQHGRPADSAPSSL